MEEIFSHQDAWGSKILVLVEADLLGIKTLGGELVLLDPEKTAELYEALGKNVGKSTS